MDGYLGCACLLQRHCSQCSLHRMDVARCYDLPSLTCRAECVLGPLLRESSFLQEQTGAAHLGVQKVTKCLSSESTSVLSTTGFISCHFSVLVLAYKITEKHPVEKFCLVCSFPLEENLR